jgi:hypothetical protein
VPRHSSERREYVPIGFFNNKTVISDAANAMYGADAWIFGLVQSRMHMVWMRAVAGRLKTDYRYSAAIVYNTFPVPPLTQDDKELLIGTVVSILDAREQFSNMTLAQLYDPKNMPKVLRQAHSRLDGVVDLIYGSQSFDSDDKRLALLFDMYERQSTARPSELNHA